MQFAAAPRASLSPNSISYLLPRADDRADEVPAGEEGIEVFKVFPGDGDDGKAGLGGPFGGRGIEGQIRAGFPRGADHFSILLPGEAVQGFGFGIGARIVAVYPRDVGEHDDAPGREAFGEDYGIVVGGESRLPAGGGENPPGEGEVGGGIGNHRIGAEAAENGAHQFGIQAGGHYAYHVQGFVGGIGLKRPQGCLPGAGGGAAADNDNRPAGRVLLQPAYQKGAELPEKD